MPLDKTKETLKRLQDKYGAMLHSAQLDIKPDYSGIGLLTRDGIGYNYLGIDEIDIDFIYTAIRSLDVSISDYDSPISFNLDYFVTETNALKALDKLKTFIFDDLVKLRQLKEKYKGKQYAHYPLQVCLTYHEEIFGILEEIYAFDEFIEFKQPGLIDSLKAKIINLEFDQYWRKREMKYFIHLITFFPFLFIAGLIITHKEEKDLVGFGKSAVLITSGLITIGFNLLFNNHSSFKDSWKLLSKNTRQELKEKERKIFLKQT